MSVDLSTSYLGLKLDSPLVVSASPLTCEVQMLQRLEQAGAAAAVMGSLFAEQIDFDRSDYGDQKWYGAAPQVTPSWAYSLSNYNCGPDSYLKRLSAAKRALRMPVIASLNGTEPGDWIAFARLMQEAGADALEINVYFVPTDPELSSADVEDRYVDLVAGIRSQVSIPLAVKIGPYFSSLPHMARRLAAAGADGLVLFNRFLQPDIDLKTLEVSPKLALSTPDELRLPLRWIGILRGTSNISLAASTGIHAADDVLKMLLAGADVTMLASVLIQHGPSYLTQVKEGLIALLEERGCSSVEQVKGLLSMQRCPTPGAYERANYARALARYSEQPEPNSSLSPSKSEKLLSDCEAG